MSRTRPRDDRWLRRVVHDRRRMAAIVVGVITLCAVGAVAIARGAGSDDAAVGSRRTPRVPATATPPVPSGGTVPGLACREGLTRDTPLRLWIAGDSLAYSVGTGLGKKAANTGVVAPVFESRGGSGLSSPGFFDWPARVANELPRLDPEVVVFVMGTNDWSTPQATPVDSSGQPAWKATYRAKVQRMVDTLTADGRTLYWVGPPVLRDPKLESGARDIAAVIRPVVADAPNAEFFDLHELLDGDGGSYATAVDVEGKRVVVRTGDGVHLTPDGADYVGAALFARLDGQCRLKAQAVPGNPQPLVETPGSNPNGPVPIVVPEPTTAAPPVTLVTVVPTEPPVTTSTTSGTPGTTVTTRAGPPPKGVAG